jgi:hypothetical protein
MVTLNWIQFVVGRFQKTALHRARFSALISPLPAKANVADEIFGRSGTLIIPDKPKHTRRVPRSFPPQAHDHEKRELLTSKAVTNSRQRLGLREPSPAFHARRDDFRAHHPLPRNRLSHSPQQHRTGNHRKLSKNFRYSLNNFRPKFRAKSTAGTTTGQTRPSPAPKFNASPNHPIDHGQ